LKEVREQTLSDQEKFQQITLQLQEVSSELRKVKNNESNKLQARRIRDKPNLNCKWNSSQMRCNQCNNLGHAAKFCRNNDQTSKRGKINSSLKRRGQRTGTDQFDEYQLAQNAEVDFEKNQSENHRWDDESKTNTPFKDDNEEMDNTHPP